MTAAFTGPLEFSLGCIVTLKGDRALNDKITEIYPSSSLKYFVGVDEEDLPGAENCPFIAFMPGNYQSDTSNAFKALGLKVSLVVQNEKKDSSTTFEVVKLLGLYDLETLTPLIVKALRPYCITQLGRGDTVKFGPIQTEVALPLHRSSFSIEANDDI